MSIPGMGEGGDSPSPVPGINCAGGFRLLQGPKVCKCAIWGYLSGLVAGTWLPWWKSVGKTQRKALPLKLLGMGGPQAPPPIARGNWTVLPYVLTNWLTFRWMNKENRRTARRTARRMAISSIWTACSNTALKCEHSIYCILSCISRENVCLKIAQKTGHQLIYRGIF